MFTCVNKYDNNIYIQINICIYSIKCVYFQIYTYVYTYGSSMNESVQLMVQTNVSYAHPQSLYATPYTTNPQASPSKIRPSNLQPQRWPCSSPRSCNKSKGLSSRIARGSQVEDLRMGIGGQGRSLYRYLIFLSN